MSVSSRFLQRFEQAKDDFKQTMCREVDALFGRFLDELNEPNSKLEPPTLDKITANIEPELSFNPLNLVQSVYFDSSNSNSALVDKNQTEQSQIELESNIKTEPEESFNLNHLPQFDEAENNDEEGGHESDFDCDCSECNGDNFVMVDQFKEESEDEEEDEVSFVQTSPGKRQKMNLFSTSQDCDLQNMVTCPPQNVVTQNSLSLTTNSNLLRNIHPNWSSTSNCHYNNDEWRFNLLNQNMTEKMRPTEETPSRTTKVRTVSLNCQSEQCELSFGSKEQIDMHMKNDHHILHYRCLAVSCRRSFSKRSELDDHIRVDHSGIIGWQCEKCPISNISDHNSLVHHNYFHHAMGNFECTHENCHFSAVTRREVHHHYSHTHQHYICHFPGCEKSFKHKSYFELHERIHSGEKPYFCSFFGCDKSFARQDILLNHERSHRGVKPYRCKWDGCQYEATKRGNVITHIRSVHFNLPRLVRDQNRLNIVDERDPRNYLEVITELLM